MAQQPGEIAVSDYGTGRVMRPWEIQASAVFKAVMESFPLLEMKESEARLLSGWGGLGGVTQRRCG